MNPRYHSEKVMPILGRTDAPQTDRTADKLNTEQYADGLARFVQDCQTPLTVGVQGEWGSGKTSLMRMVEGQLRASNKPILLSWFDTWQYGAIDDDEGLGIQLLLDLSRLLTQDLLNNADAQRTGTKIRGTLLSLGRLAKRGAKAIGSAVAAGTISQFTSFIDGGTLVDSIGSPTDGEDGPSLAAVRKAFQQLVQQYVKKAGGAESGARVVVFVDDLDRIRPGRAVALLEILKNFIDIEHCVFIIACDHDVVREGVRERLGIVDSPKVDAFFHKLFQVPFQMPVATYDNTNFLIEYLHSLLPAGRAREATNKDRARDLAVRLSPLITEAMGTNPRALKRFFNISDLMLCVDDARPKNGADPAKMLDRDNTDQVGVYLALVALHSRWPSIAAYLARNRKLTDLDRAFSTLIADSELPDEQVDEELEGLMQASYAESPNSSVQWRRTSEAERLSRFARELIKILPTTGAKGGTRTPDLGLVGSLLGTMRLVANSSESQYHTPFFKFRESALAHSAEIGDAFFGVVRALDTRFGRDPRFTILRSDSRYSLQINNKFGSQLAPMSLYIKDETAGGGLGPLLIRVNLGRKAASGAGCAELVQLGETFITQTRALGAEWVTHGEGYRLDFMQRRVPQASMDSFRDAVLELHERCAQALLVAATQHREDSLNTATTVDDHAPSQRIDTQQAS